MKKFLVLIMSVMAVVSVSAAKKTVSGSESSPDFAFPQTVAADASEKMGKAMKGSRCVELCHAACGGRQSRGPQQCAGFDCDA